MDTPLTAKKVFLVMSSRGGRPRHVRVLVDGRPVPASRAGEDVTRGQAEVSEERLYRLISLPKVGEHRLTLRFDPGVAGYAFTFG